MRQGPATQAVLLCDGIVDSIVHPWGANFDRLPSAWTLSSLRPPAEGVVRGVEASPCLERRPPRRDPHHRRSDRANQSVSAILSIYCFKLVGGFVCTVQLFPCALTRRLQYAVVVHVLLVVLRTNSIEKKCSSYVLSETSLVHPTLSGLWTISSRCFLFLYLHLVYKIL